MRSLIIVALVSTSCAAQQPSAQQADPQAPAAQLPVLVQAPTSQPAPVPSGETGIVTDDLLDAMEKVGVDLKSLKADLALNESDAGTGAQTVRTGSIKLQRRGPGDTRGHVVFDKMEADGKRYREKVEYLLEGDWVTDRVYGRSGDTNFVPRQTRRQVRKAGDKTDLLKLGEGPLPLPIGQPREVVKAEFEVNRLPDEADKPGLVGLELRPRETNRLSQRFESITVWVDPKDAMPRVVQTIDPNQTTIRETKLSNVVLNDGVTDADFTLEPIDESKWQVAEEKME